MARWKRFLTTSKSDGMAVTVAGTADAVGENTAASADVTMRTVERGRVTVTYGKATLEAAGDGYAAAQGGVTTVGADLALSRTWTTTTADAQRSTTGFLSLDVAGVDFRFGQLTLGKTIDRAAGGTTGVAQGNLTRFAVDAEARGGTSLVSVRTDALTVEDQLSSVAVSVTTVTGDPWM